MLRFEGKNYIFEAADPRSFKIVELRTGSSKDGWVEIINHDLPEGKRIGTKEAYTLLMGLKNKAEA